MSCFPTIMDNPDILEIFVKCWSEDVLNQWSTAAKLNTKDISRAATDYIWRIYPILFADGELNFDKIGHPTDSACGDKHKLKARRELIESALRYG